MPVSFDVKMGRPGRYSSWNVVLKNYIDPETGAHTRKRLMNASDETSAKRLAEREIGNAQEIIVILYRTEYGRDDSFQILTRQGVWKTITPKKRDKHS